MILADMQEYLETHGRAAVLDLVYRFESDAATVRSMLAMLERKGQVRRLPCAVTCDRGCMSCTPDQFDCYEWTGRQAGNPASRQT